MQNVAADHLFGDKRKPRRLRQPREPQRPERRPRIGAQRHPGGEADQLVDEPRAHQARGKLPAAFAEDPRQPPRVLVFIGLPSTYDDTITGVMLIVIVVFDAIIRSRDIEKARRARLSLRAQLVKETKGDE